MLEAVKGNDKISESEIRRRLLLLKEHVDKEEENLKEARKHNLIDLWKTKNMFKYCLVLYLNLFVNGFVGYGISLNIGDFGAIADIVSNLCQVYVFKRWRRIPVMISILWLNLSTILRIAIAMSIRFFGDFAFHLAYVQSTEIIPTTMRQLGVGSCTVSIRVGSIMAPFIREF
ncbi:organic cation transporter protein-like protein, partial [Leptotrombidium deliense]